MVFLCMLNYLSVYMGIADDPEKSVTPVWYLTLFILRYVKAFVRVFGFARIKFLKNASAIGASVLTNAFDSSWCIFRLRP